MADANGDVEALYDTILFCARHGWSDPSYLLNAALGFLPDDLLRGFWRELAEPPVTGHAPEMLAIVIREGFLNTTSAAWPASPPALPEPMLDSKKLDVAQYLLDNPGASIGVLEREFKLARHTARYWRSGHKGIQAYLDFHWRPRIEALFDRARKTTVARLAQYLAEPSDIATRREFIKVADYVARHPGWTFDEVELATDVPGFLVRRWTSMPQFEAAVTEKLAQQQQPPAGTES